MAMLLPGDVITPELLPQLQNTSKALMLGPSLRFTHPSAIHATAAGSLAVDARKNAIWLETNAGGRYNPSAGDLVIATVHHSSTDFYHCAITSYSPLATLPQLAFEGATKKTRPVLSAGSLVYARVALANKHMDPELECVHPSTGKSEGLGELKSGMVFDISLNMARRLMKSKTREDGGVAILEELGEKGLKFEVAVGRNGRVWVNSDSTRSTITIGRALQETDERALTVDQQLKLVKNLVKTG